MDASLARALKSGSASKAEPPIQKKAIETFTEEQFLARSGLHRTAREQRRIDELHERLHQAYEGGEIKKTLLAFYLWFFASERQNRLAAALPPLEAGDEENGLGDY